jgi:hypothetical protein
MRARVYVCGLHRVYWNQDDYTREELMASPGGGLGKARQIWWVPGKYNTRGGPKPAATAL